jgi:hypothetical protein
LLAEKGSVTTSNDLDEELADARARTDDDELRAFEARFNVAWETMSDREREHAIGALVRMLEEAGLRLH